MLSTVNKLLKSHNKISNNLIKTIQNFQKLKLQKLEYQETNISFLSFSIYKMRYSPLFEYGLYLYFYPELNHKFEQTDLIKIIRNRYKIYINEKTHEIVYYKFSNFSKDHLDRINGYCWDEINNNSFESTIFSKFKMNINKIVDEVAVVVNDKITNLGK